MLLDQGPAAPLGPWKAVSQILQNSKKHSRNLWKMFWRKAIQFCSCSQGGFIKCFWEPCWTSRMCPDCPPCPCMPRAFRGTSPNSSQEQWSYLSFTTVFMKMFIPWYLLQTPFRLMSILTYWLMSINVSDQRLRGKLQNKTKRFFYEVLWLVRYSRRSSFIIYCHGKTILYDARFDFCQTLQDQLFYKQISLKNVL